MTALTAVMRAAEEGDYDLVLRRVAALSTEDRITIRAAVLDIQTAIREDMNGRDSCGCPAGDGACAHCGRVADDNHKVRCHQAATGYKEDK